MWQIESRKLPWVVVSGCLAFAVGLPMADGSIVPVERELVQDERIEDQQLPPGTIKRLIRWEGLESGQALNISRVQTVNRLFQIEDQFETTSPGTLATSILLPADSSFSLSANGMTKSFGPTTDDSVIDFESLFGSAVSTFTLHRTVFIDFPLAQSGNGLPSPLEPFVFISPYFPVELTFNQANTNLQLVKTVTSVVPEPSAIGLAVIASVFFVRRGREKGGAIERSKRCQD